MASIWRIQDRVRRATSSWPFALCFLGTLTEGFDIQAAGITARKVAASFGFNSALLGVAFSASIIGLFAGAVGGGWAADYAGRKRVLLGCLLTVAVFSIATAIAPTRGIFIVSRVLSGVGLGGLIATLISVTAEMGSSATRTSRVTILIAGIPLGGTCVSLMAYWLPPAYDWRLIFIVGGILPLALMIPVRDKLPTGDAHIREHRGSFSCLFERGSRMITICLCCACFATLLTLHLLLNWLPSLLVQMGHTPQASALVTVMFNAGGGVGAIVLGVLVRTRSQALVLTIAYAGIAAGLGLLLACGSTVSGAMLGGFGTGFFLIGAQALIYGLTPGFYRHEALSTGVGFTLGVGRLGSMLGPLVAGWVLMWGHGSAVIFGGLLPLIALALLAALVLLTLRRPGLS